MREKMEQTAVYGSLLVMLVLLITFGISTAEKGVKSLVGQPTAPVHTNVTVIQTNGHLDTSPRILGKDLSGTKQPWSKQISQNLDGQHSAVASLVDNASLTIGSLLQGGAKKLLSGLSSMLR